MERYISVFGNVVHTSSAFTCKVEGLERCHTRCYNSNACPICHNYSTWRNGLNAPDTSNIDADWGGNGHWM